MKKLIPLLLIFLIPLYFLRNEEQSPQQLPAEEMKCDLLIQVNGTKLTIDDYLVGVLAGEMPASFHEEALKAQAIAARTYVLKQTNYGQTEISSTTAHQVFNDKAARQQKWKTAFSTYEMKLADAVNQTANEVLTFDGQLITAMFHASSFERTESAKNYSDKAIPYLQSVPSPDQLTAHESHFTWTQLNQLLQQTFKPQHYKAAKLVRNSSNRVAAVEINGVTWEARKFRELLNLRSTQFEWHATETGILVKTFGYGHGVGMSQHGANAFAEEGLSAYEILSHYYPETIIERVDYCSEK